MDDRLTYKIGEVDGVAMMFIRDAAEKLREEMRRFAESLRDQIGDLLDGIFKNFSEAVRDTPNRPSHLRSVCDGPYQQGTVAHERVVPQG